MSTKIQRFRYAILFAALLLLAGVWSAVAKPMNSSARCSRDQSCDIGDTRLAEFTITTVNAVLGLDLADNTLTLTSGSTAPRFVGADAADPADTTFDTTGAGTLTLGSADVLTISLVNDGAMNIGAGTTDSVVVNGALTITMVTDEGTVTVDGDVQADMGPFVTLASGTLTANTIHLATAAATYTIPTCVAANIGEWVTVIVQDISEIVTLDLVDASNTISAAGAIISTGHVIDSGASATGDGDFITLTCVAAEIWYSTKIGGVWVDGGAT